MANKNIQPFVVLALTICEKMEIGDKRGQSMIMRFCKLYKPEKIARIYEMAKSFIWWRRMPVAAFMKAVGIINKQEKNAESGMDKTP